MHKSLKVLVAMLKGVDVAFSIFIPIALVLLLVSFENLTGVSATILLIIGILATIYRSIKFLVFL